MTAPFTPLQATPASEQVLPCFDSPPLHILTLGYGLAACHPHLPCFLKLIGRMLQSLKLPWKLLLPTGYPLTLCSWCSLPQHLITRFFEHSCNNIDFFAFESTLAIPLPASWKKICNLCQADGRWQPLVGLQCFRYIFFKCSNKEINTILSHFSFALLQQRVVKYLHLCI